ncbi:MAG: hypothetical protein Q8M79_01325 [Dehalococcoidia bacterium]|nr:hypothetical protein [Dehalococcoidia bacterium]
MTRRTTWQLSEQSSVRHTCRFFASSRVNRDTLIHVVQAGAALDFEVTDAISDGSRSVAVETDSFHDLCHTSIALLSDDEQAQLRATFAETRVSCAFQRYPPKQQGAALQFLRWLIANPGLAGDHEFYPDLYHSKHAQNPEIRRMIPPIPGMSHIWVMRGTGEDGLRFGLIRELEVWDDERAILAVIGKKVRKRYMVDAPFELAVFVRGWVPSEYGLVRIGKALGPTLDRSAFRRVWLVDSSAAVRLWLRS